MLKDDERREVDQMIADRLEAEHIVSIFTTMDERQKELLTQSLMPFLRAQKPPLRSPENFYTFRWTQDDADVNTSVGGSSLTADQRGFQNPTLPRWLDQVGGSSWLDPDDPQIVHFKGAGGGGTDCMFDWLVSECWADEVAAGRGTEGQAFVSLTGCTFYVTSLVQYAWDGIGDGAAFGAKEFTTDCEVFICGGGVGPLAISGDTGDSAFTVHFIGASRDETGIANAGATALSITGGSKPLIFRDLNITASSDQALNKTSSQDIYFVHCNIDFTSGGETNVISDGRFFAHDTYFGTNTSTQYTLDFNGNASMVELTACGIADRIRMGTELWLHQCKFDRGANSVGVVAGSGVKYLYANGCRFRHSNTQFDYYFDLNDATTINFHIFNSVCHIGASNSAIRTGASYNNEGITNHVIGNDFKADIFLDHNLSSLPMTVICTGNTGAGTEGVGLPALRPLVARGRFDNSVFDGNGPAGAYVSITSSSSYFNRVNGVQIAAGVPSHTATYGQFYKNITTDDIYTQQTDPTGTSWAVVGVSGGGAAAPSPHDFVGIHHDHDTDFTQTPNVDGLGVGASGINVYSDAGTTFVGQWDASTGRLIVAPDSSGDDLVIAGSTRTANFAMRQSGTGNLMQGLFSLHTSSSPTTTGTRLLLAKSNGTYAAQTAVAADDMILQISGAGHDGTDYAQSGSIELFVDGAVASNQVPGRWVFKTASPSLTENMRISSGGGIWMSSYLRAGALSAPTNTTAGDLTATRLIVPNATILHSAITQLGGPVVIPAAGELRFSDSDDSNYVGIQAPATAQSENWVIHLPADDPVVGDDLHVLTVSSPDVTTEWSSRNHIHYKHITVEDPTATEVIPWFFEAAAITITTVYTWCVAGTSVTFNIEHGTNPTSRTDLYASDQVADTLTSVETHSTSYADATVAAGAAVYLTTSAVSGSVTEFHCTVAYTRD